MIRLSQKQWFKVFDYAYGVLLALALGGVAHWLDFPWWYTSIAYVCFLGPWFRGDK